MSNSFESFLQQKALRSITPAYLLEISDNLIKKKFGIQDLNIILTQNKIQDIKLIKPEALNFLISYANFILEDSIISESEYYDFTALKKIFKVKEGDFIKFKNFEITEILQKEFLRIYSDHFVDKIEEILNFNLQSLFDLSYDEFEYIKQDEIIHALLNGANPIDLDISKIPKGFIVTLNAKSKLPERI